MDIYKETFETWNKIATLYQDKFMDLDLYNKTYDSFCNSLKKVNSSVLEIGCGPGNIAKYLLTKRPDLSISGIDIAPNMIALAVKNNPTASFEVMDCRNIHQIETKYNGIICGFCLPYLTEIDSLKLIADCQKLLLDQGVLYISFVEGDKSQSGFQVSSGGDRTYFHYYSIGDLKKMLVNNGFEEPEIFKVNYKKTDDTAEIHTILLTKKKII